MSLRKSYCKVCGRPFETCFPSRKYCDLHRDGKKPPFTRACIVCNENFKVTYKNAKVCPICRPRYSSASSVRARKIKEKKLVVTYEKVCPTCGTEFTTIYKKQRYCKPECRPNYAHLRKSEVIAQLREDYLSLKLVNPLEAQKIVKEMESLEGKKFREVALDGLVW